jgi:hypothetical protein
MDKEAARSVVVRMQPVEVPDDMLRKFRRLAGGARSCLDRHSARMETNPAYRETVEYLMKMLCPPPSDVDQTVADIAAGTCSPPNGGDAAREVPDRKQAPRRQERGERRGEGVLVLPNELGQRRALDSTH